MDCLVKSFYSSKDNRLNLENQINEIYYTIKKVKLNKDSTITRKFFDELVRKVNDNSDFDFSIKYVENNTSDKNTKYFKSLSDFATDVLSIIKNSNDITKINLLDLHDMFINEFATAMGVGTKSTRTISIPEVADIPGIELTETEQSFKDFIDQVYGINQGAEYLRFKQFEMELFNHTTIDFIGENATNDIIKSEDELNRHILLFKNILYSRIISFLNTVYPDNAYPSTLYDENGAVNMGYINVYNDFLKYLDTHLDLSKLISDSYIDTVSTGQDNQFLNALNAYTNLKYFDTILKDAAGRYVTIRSDKYKNKEVGIEYSKYRYALDNEHKRTSWNEDGDARTAAQNTSRFSKMILNHIPIEHSIQGIPYTSIGITNFQNAYSTLFSKINNIPVTSNTRAAIKDLINAVYDFPNSHIYYSNLITELIATDLNVQDALKTYLNMTDNQLDVFKSVYKHIFSLDNKHSIRSIQIKARKTRFNLGKYTVLEDLCGLIRDCVDSTYMDTLVKYNGEVVYYEREKSKRSNGAEKLAAKINATIQNATSAIVNNLNNSCIINNNRYSGNFQNVNVEIKGFKLNGEDVSLKFQFTNEGLLGILTQSENYKIVPTDNQSATLFTKLNDLDLVTILNDSRNRELLLSNADINDEDLHNLKTLLQFFDERLNTKYLTDDGLLLYNVQNSIEKGRQTWQRDLLPFAIKAQIISNIYNDFNKLDKYKTLKSYLKTNTIYKNAIEDFSQSKTYFSVLEGDYNILTVPNNTQWLRSYDKARQIIFGEDVSSVSKNFDNNNDANTSTSYLGATINQINHNYKKLKDLSVTTGELYATDSLLFTDHNKAIVKSVINSSAKINQKVKMVKDMKGGELLYQSIFHGFYSDPNLITVQPTTYSDKTKILQYRISTSYNFTVDGKKVNLNNISLNEVQLLYFNTIGNFAKTSFINTKNKLCDTLGISREASVKEINELLKGETEESLIAKAEVNNINLILDLDYRVSNNRVFFNEVLDYLANYLYSDINNLKRRLTREKLNFIKDLKASRVNFYLGYAGTSQQLKNKTNQNISEIDAITTWINSDASTKTAVANAIKNLYKTAKAIKEYLENWTKNGKLLITNDKNQLNPLLERYFYIYSLLSNNLRLALTGSETAHPDKSYYMDDLLKKLPTDYAQKVKSGELTISDLLYDENQKVKQIAIDTLITIENVAQGTQLKRNVIIPATMHHVQVNDLKGVNQYINVAVARDIKAHVFNFSGDKGRIDSMDGSALVLSLQSILENYSLGSQEVGVDKKPIWHDYDPKTGIAKLMKFATFAMTNARIKDSLNSDVSLYNLIKKMMNQLWSTDGYWDINGKKVEINLLDNCQLNYPIRKKLNFANDIARGRNVYYKALDGSYKEILDFGKDANGYYTIEHKVDKFGILDFLEESEKIYHYFDEQGNHYNEAKLGVTHNINSLFELWETLGGCYSMELNNGIMDTSEASNYLVVEFMNQVCFKRSDNIKTLDQTTYWQPLKEKYIGYLVNNSAMKNGATNINGSNVWTDNSELHSFKMNAKYLGIQMDADHDIEEAKLTEFSQVLTALEAGGRLHNIANLVYKDLAKLAVSTAKIEIDAAAKLITADIEGTDLSLVKSDLYNIIGNVLIDSIKDDRSDISEAIISKIAKRFNKNRDHIKDVLKLPLSDPNLYSQILSTFISNINNKSIKRKYPGSGCVMVPGYNIMQYFRIPNGDGTFRKLKFDDVFEEAIEHGITTNILNNSVEARRDIVSKYLTSITSGERILKSATDFIPTDVVDIVDNNGNTCTIKLDSLDIYNAFESRNWDKLAKLLPTLANVFLKFKLATSFKYFDNITVPRDLAPSRISWRYMDGGIEKGMNLFLLPEIGTPQIQLQLDNIANGFFILNGKKYAIKEGTLINEPAELIISNGYASLYGLEGKSIALIEKEGVDAFAVNPPTVNKSRNWDIAFGKANGEVAYISFSKSKIDSNNRLIKKDWKPSRLRTIESDDGALNVWYCSKDGIPLFKVGRKIKSENIRYISPQYDANGKLIKDGYYEKQNGVDDNNNPIWDIVKDDSNLSLDKDGSVLQYIQYLTKYNRIEPIMEDGKVIGYDDFDSYLIDNFAIRKVMSEGSKTHDVSNFVRSVLDEVFGSGKYSTVFVNQHLNKIAADIVTTSVNGMKLLPSYVKSELLAPVVNELNNQKYNPKNENIKEFNLSTILLDNNVTTNMDELQDKVFELLKLERYASWKQSLQYIAARIPAQSLQSFMKMQAIAYTGDKKNVVHVSHWQTYLQGSDYDIDKAYMMGFEIGEDGILYKYSSILNYSTPELIEASLTLPTPNHLTLSIDINSNFDITEDLINIKNSTDEANKLRLTANLLVKLNLHYENSNTDDSIVRFNYDTEAINSAWVNQYIKDYLQKHEYTEISPQYEQQAYKVAIAANIGNIVLNIRNMVQSYSPIKMDDLQDSASKSEKGLAIKSMSLINPATIFLMQVLNMVGKKVIGIAAVGEKVFFNASYYWNKGIQSNDENYIRNLQFSLTFNRIEGRNSSFIKDAFGKYSGTIKSVTKTKLANANFESNPDLVERFTSDDNKLIAQNIATMALVLKYQGQNLDTIPSEEIEAEVRKALFNMYQNEKAVDLMISQVLSAATDNAKELILAKINCSTDLAKCYLHLLMMGFDIKDIVAFMTSPVIECVNNLLEVNIFDSYVNELSLTDVIKMMRGEINPDVFYVGNTSGEDEFGERIFITRALKEFSNLSNKLAKYNLSAKSFSDLIAKYIRVRLQGEDLPKLEELSKEYLTRILSDYVEGLITSIQLVQNKYADPLDLDFELDLAEFEKIVKLANETSTLGNTMLGMNQGLPTDKAGLLNKLKAIADICKTREREFNIYKNTFGPKAKEKNTLKIYEAILANNPTLSMDYIKEVIQKALKYDVIENFEIEKWLYDVKFDDGTSYRDLISEYYNILKGTWNIFDMMDKLPQYKEIINLLKLEYVVDKHTSIKSNLVNKITLQIIDKYLYLDERTTKAVTDYVNDLLVINFFDLKSLNFPLTLNSKAFDSYGELINVTTSDQYANLATPEGRATFKRIMEKEVIPNLSRLRSWNGYHISPNDFIDNLTVTYDTDGTTYLTTDLNLSDVKKTPSSMIKYQKYITGINELENIKINGYSLQDWLIIYNLITNLNKYGAERLTKLFEEVVKRNDSSILRAYYQYLGDLDYSSLFDIQDALGFNLDDVLVRSAVNKSESQVGSSKELCLRVQLNNGNVLYKIKIPTKRSYRNISIYPSRDITSTTDSKLSSQIRANYLRYWTMPMKNRSLNNALYSGIISQSPNEILKTLEIYIKKGNIQIIRENC